MIEISVVIPCYKESEILPETIERLEKFFYRERNNFVYQMIFVDDGSQDYTFKLLTEYYKGKKNYCIISYPFNIGKGYAVRQGIKEAKYNNILILDADLSVRPEELSRISNMYNLSSQKTYIIKGERHYIIPQTKFRVFLGRCFQILHKIWLNIGIDDSQCPFMIFHNVPKKFAYELKIDGFSYDLEVLYKAKKENINIIKTKVSYYNNTDSKVTTTKVLQMFFDLIRIKFL